jgi:predicted TIM-barrel fold metal-dependent hydrolase
MAVAEREVQQTSGGLSDGLRRIDVDCHHLVLEFDLLPYLPERWQDYLDTIGLRQAAPLGSLVGAQPLVCRTDAWGPDGELPGTDLALFRHQLLDAYDIDVAILNSMQMQNPMMMGPGSPRALLAGLARGGNEHTHDHWLDADPRFRGAICVAFEDPEATVAEIERCAPDPRWVQILLPFRTIDPIGHHRYWPMFEVAEHHRLPIALHPGMTHVATGAGQQSVYYEFHTDLPSALFPQMASLIFEGVFDRFPSLQISLQEGGWSWVPAFMWRLDSLWTLLKDEVPDLQRAPSEYVRDHFWFTTQPIEEPESERQFSELWAQFVRAGMRERLMFSSDYPHWDWDAPDAAIPVTMPDEDRDAIFRLNPLSCYSRLEATRSPDRVLRTC